MRLPAAAPCAAATTALERRLRGWSCNNETATDLQGLGFNPTPDSDPNPNPNPDPDSNQAAGDEAGLDDDALPANGHG